MKILGTVLHISSHKNLIVRGDEPKKDNKQVRLPRINSIVLDQKKNKIGKINDVFGPVKQPYFSVEKGKRYLFSNISCRINKYNNRIEFHYDPEYYGSYYEEWPKQQEHYQKTSPTSPLEELLKEFGCSPSATAEDVKLKKRYWNQVLHPDFNVGKPEKLRKQMEEELKQKNELYDKIINLMNK